MSGGSRVGIVMVLACLALSSATPRLSRAQTDSSAVDVPAAPPRNGPFSWWIPASPIYNSVFMRAEGDSVIVVTAPWTFEARCRESNGDYVGLARFQPERLAALLQFHERLRTDRMRARSRQARAPRDTSVRSADADSVFQLLRARRRGPNVLLATWMSPSKGSVLYEETWTNAGQWHAVEPRTRDDMPELGEYVLVDRHPEPIVRVPPAYPDLAREKGVDGQVLVHALVGWDGLVKRTVLAVSIAELDSAATAAVQQWRFKPALIRGKPVPVWVPVPVKFSLH